MSNPFPLLAVLLLVIATVVIYRAIRGPTLYDRLIAVSTMGTKTVVLLCLVGFVYGRLNMFMDIAIGYAMLNFIGTIAFASYLEKKGPGL
jgi:multicomponent Na+:H+ antiporter subunit F